MNQEHYIDSIELIDLSQALFRSKVGAMNCQITPDIFYEVMELSTCFKKATVRNLKEVSKCTKTV